MSERERYRPQRTGPPGAAPGGEGGSLGATQANIGRLLDAADAAIDRGLSQNSEQFVRAARQSSGQ